MNLSRCFYIPRLNLMVKTIFASIFSILLSIDVYAQDLPGSLQGKIIDKESNSIVSFVNIKIIKPGLKEYLQTTSDLSGNYKFQNLEEGIYEISTSHIGFKNYSNKFLIQPRKFKSLNVFLEPIEIEIEKINVTSAKTEVTLQQTPSSISIVSSDDIKKKNIITFDNILEEVQGITINRSSGINVNSLSIRGSSDVAGGGIGNRVLLLLDGRPSLTGDSKGALWSLIPVSIIERTEVVKGAFSSLYGSSAIGGLDKVETDNNHLELSPEENILMKILEKL